MSEELFELYYVTLLVIAKESSEEFHDLNSARKVMAEINSKALGALKGKSQYVWYHKEVGDLAVRVKELEALLLK